MSTMALIINDTKMKGRVLCALNLITFQLLAAQAGTYYYIKVSAITGAQLYTLLK